MRVVKGDVKLENFGLISTNFSYHGYIYNRLYNNNWQSFALQLIACLKYENEKRTGEQIAERRL